MDVIMASFNQMERTNLEANRAIRWKEPGSLDDGMEQSDLPFLDHKPIPGPERERNLHLF